MMTKGGRSYSQAGRKGDVRCGRSYRWVACRLQCLHMCPQKSGKGFQATSSIKQCLYGCSCERTTSLVQLHVPLLRAANKYR